MRALDMNPGKAPAVVATHQLAKSEERERTTRPTPWMLWWIVGVHLSWGIALVVHPKTLDALVLIGVDWITGWGLSAWLIGGLLITVSAMAAVGLLAEPTLRREPTPASLWLLVGLLCPQYFVVLAAMISDLNLIAEGSFNGRDVDRWLLLGALAPVVWGALFHTASILERYVIGWKR